MSRVACAMNPRMPPSWAHASAWAHASESVSIHREAGIPAPAENLAAPMGPIQSRPRRPRAPSCRPRTSDTLPLSRMIVSRGQPAQLTTIATGKSAAWRNERARSAVRTAIPGPAVWAGCFYLRLTSRAGPLHVRPARARRAAYHRPLRAIFGVRLWACITFSLRSTTPRRETLPTLRDIEDATY